MKTTETFANAAPKEFSGAKLALLTEDSVVSILRDDKNDIPYPACWDLPGGGREGNETPEACVLRETREEIGLSLSIDALFWRRAFASECDLEMVGWFFVAQISDDQVEQIRLGDEGQRWRKMKVTEFLCIANGVPYLQNRLQVYFDERAES